MRGNGIIIMAFLSVFAMVFVVVSTETNANVVDSNGEILLDSDGNPMTVEEFNLKSIGWDETLFVLKVEATSYVQKNSSIDLDSIRIFVIGGTEYGRGYAASSCSIIDDGAERSQPYLEKDDNDKILNAYWLFRISITLTSQGYPTAYTAFVDILSKIQFKTMDVEFDNSYHTVEDALNGYELTIVSGTVRAKNIGHYVTIVRIDAANVSFIFPVGWSIVSKPVDNVIQFEGTAYVNTIQTDGYITASMFTDENTFICLDTGLTYSYVEDEFGKQLLVNDNKNHSVVKRSNCMIVVKDASGQVVIDEIAGVVAGVTMSERNTIELYGVDGYVGCVTGIFSVELTGTHGLIYKGGVVVGYEGTATEVVVPDTHCGHKVTKIADKAFLGNKDITSIVIGDNVKTIGMKAFANCVNLRSIVFGDSVKVVSYYAFYACKQLVDIDFDSKLIAVRDGAFNGTTFQDAFGNVLDPVAENLAGNYFEGFKRILKLVS